MNQRPAEPSDHIVIVRKGTLALARCAGTLHRRMIEEFIAIIEQQLVPRGVECVVCSLKRTEHIEADAMGALKTLSDVQERTGVQIVIMDASDHVQQLLCASDGFSEVLIALSDRRPNLN